MARSCNCPSHHYVHSNHKIITDTSTLTCSICRKKKPGCFFVQFQCGRSVCIPCQSTQDKIHIGTLGPELDQIFNKQTQSK